MLKALLKLAHLFVTVPVLEFAGMVLVTAAVWGAAGVWAGIGCLGVLFFLKAFDLALDKAS